MEQLDPARLQAILDLLASSGVEEFEGFGFHVRFAATMFTKDREVPQDPAEVMRVTMDERAEPQSIWEIPELWPGGKPPSFPKK